MARTILTTLCAFRTLLDGYPLPPPPDTGYRPNPPEQLFAFMLGYLLLLGVLLLMLPKKWADTITEVAFHVSRKGETK